MDVDVSYMTSDNWVEHDMRERMRWLRENDPVRWNEADNLWIVSRYEDVVYCSKHQEIFTSGQGVRPGLTAKIGLIDEEEPRHGQLRGLINRGFTPRMVRKLEEDFLHITTQAIDEVARDGKCDFVSSISVPLPLRLIASMIGIREEDYDSFAQWSNAMIAAEGRHDDIEVMTKASASYIQYASYVNEVIEDRRKNPKDDLVSILTGAKDEGLLMEYDEDKSHFEGHTEKMGLANDELIKLMQRPVFMVVLLIGLGLAIIQADFLGPALVPTLAFLKSLGIIFLAVFAIRSSNVILEALSRNRERFPLIQARTLPLFYNVSLLVIIGDGQGTLHLRLDGTLCLGTQQFILLCDGFKRPQPAVAREQCATCALPDQGIERFDVDDMI